jgi:hypothetical protein
MVRVLADLYRTVRSNSILKLFPETLYSNSMLSLLAPSKRVENPTMSPMVGNLDESPVDHERV